MNPERTSPPKLDLDAIRRRATAKVAKAQAKLDETSAATRRELDEAFAEDLAVAHVEKLQQKVQDGKKRYAAFETKYSEITSDEAIASAENAFARNFTAPGTELSVQETLAPLLQVAAIKLARDFRAEFLRRVHRDLVGTVEEELQEHVRKNAGVFGS